MKRVFIVGTDTDCGKTYMSCQLLAYVRAHHQKALGIKPVASGCRLHQGQLISDDAFLLQQASMTAHALDEINPWRFAPPMSPHLAAAAVGVELSLDAITAFCFNPRFNTHDILVIEGAGGLMAPLTQDATWADFLKASQIPVILVVGMRLGCLNHALLTAHAMQTLNIPCVGWIANCIDPHMLALEDNIQTLKTRLGFPHLASVAYGGGLEWVGSSNIQANG